MFSVLTYNCGAGNCNVNNIAYIIANSDADVICLQEYNQKVATALEEFHLEEKYIFITSPTVQGWIQNVIYSKFPVVKTHFYESNGITRKNIMVRILVNDTFVDVVCVHLDPGRQNKDKRYQQFVSLFNNFIRTKSPTIIVGDFNMDKKEIASIPPIKNWFLSPLIGTYDSDNMCLKTYSVFSHPFDFSIYHKLDLLTVEKIAEDIRASDHYPLFFVFRFTN